MARLWQSGFEQNTTATDVEWTATNGSTSIQTTTVRSGTYAFQVTSLSSGTAMRLRYQPVAAANTGPFFARVYLRVDTRPSAANHIFRFTNGATMVTDIDLNSDGTLQLRDEDGTVGSASSVLNPTQWYMVEMRMDATPGAGSHVVEARLDGAVFATSSARSLSTGITSVAVGGNLNSEAQTTGNWYFDDVAINDSSGSSQTSYPGPGAIIHLKPSAAGDSNGFTVGVGGTAGQANNFGRVQEVTPDDATTYNGSAVLNSEDLFACDDTPSTLSSDDTINVVAVGVRMADLVGADATAAFKLELEKTASGTKSQSADLVPNSTSWITNGASPRNYPLVTYTDPSSVAWKKETLDTCQVGYIQDVTNVQTIAVSAVWVSVDFTHVTGEPHNYGRYVKVGNGMSRSEGAS